MTQEINVKDYHKRDPLSFAQGAFKGLTTMLPKGVSVVRSGGTFAVSSRFPWLVFGRAIGSQRPARRETKEQWLKRIYFEASHLYETGPQSTTLYLPASSAAGVTSINASAGVGGGVHEAGHVICDQAGGKFPTYEQFRSKVGVHLDQDIDYTACDFAKWVNVTADMRLEPGMALEYPEVSHRFFSIQEWVHELEAPHRGQKVPSDFLMALRDKGKGWVNDDSTKVYNEYDQEARDLVDYLKPFWSMLKPKTTDWASTAHLPVYVAVEVINALHQLLKEPPNPKGGKGNGNGNGNGQGEGLGQGGDDQGGDDQGQGDDQGKGAGKSPMSLEDIRSLLDGEGEALDPSSAMKQEVEKNSQQLDHKLYIPNGSKPIYRKLL